MSVPWVEKYRPESLDELISHTEIIQTLNQLVDNNQLPHLLLYGPPGTGKTSTVLALARRIFGKRYKSRILELNASDDRGIGVVRDQIKEFASTRTMFNDSGFKLVVLDECDATTKIAQAALRRIIEKYSKNVRFCLICNYVSNVIPAIQSRCTRLRFAPLQQSQIEERLNHVLEQELVDLTPDGRKALLRLSAGDMRKCLNILQSACMSSTTTSNETGGRVVDEASIYASTGAPMPADIELCADWLLNESFTTAFAQISRLKTDKGLALVDMVREIHRVVCHVGVSPAVKIFLFEQLADLEYRLAFATSERIQLTSLVSMFQVARKMIAAELDSVMETSAGNVDVVV